MVNAVDLQDLHYVKSQRNILFFDIDERDVELVKEE